MEDKKIIESITKLIQLTQENNLRWGVADMIRQQIITNEERRIDGAVFVARYKTKQLRIYKLKEKVPETDALLNAFYGKPTVSWKKYINLELINDQCQTLWTFPQVSALNDLYYAIQQQASGATDLINDLLS